MVLKNIFVTFNNIYMTKKHHDNNETDINFSRYRTFFSVLKFVALNSRRSFKRRMYLYNLSTKH